MISSTSFKLKRPQVEAISKNFFHLWRLQMRSKEKDLERQDLLDDGTMHWITYLSLLQELDEYFASRVRSTAKKDITITLTTAQAMCLYRAVTHLPLPDDEYYLVQVRQALVENLFSFFCNLPFKVGQRRKLAAAETDYWD